jgi:hypothetical protein
MMNGKIVEITPVLNSQNLKFEIKNLRWEKELLKGKQVLEDIEIEYEYHCLCGDIVINGATMKLTLAYVDVASGPLDGWNWHILFDPRMHNKFIVHSVEDCKQEVEIQLGIVSL